MRTKSTALSPHSKKVLELLQKSGKPLSAYDLLDKLHKFGIKAPATVYRALENLTERGLVHRIESLNAFVACHPEHGDHHHHEEHSGKFAVCRACGTAVEIHDHRLGDLIADLGRNLHFHIERDMLELLGLCQDCEPNDAARNA